MNYSLFLLLPLLACCAATMYAQPSTTYPRMMFVTYDGAPLYDSASYMSAVVAELRIGDSVQVLGVSGKYYRIVYGDREGFLLWSNLAMEFPKKVKKASSEKKKKARKEKADDTARTEKSKKSQRISIDTGKESLTPDSSSAVSSAPSEQPTRREGKVKGTRCRAVTKSGAQCSRSAIDSSGYCWQHN